MPLLSIIKAIFDYLTANIIYNGERLKASLLSKNQLLVLLICSIVLLVSISMSSAQIFINCLLLLVEGFICCSSPAPLGARLAFVLSSFQFLDGCLYCDVFPSQDCFCCIPKILNGYIFILISFHESFLILL